MRPPHTPPPRRCSGSHGHATRSKYQFMEVNTQRRATGLKDKIPDIQKTLDTVRFLKTRKVRTQTRSQPPRRRGACRQDYG